MDRAKWAICSAYLASPLLCVPVYFTFAIKAIEAKKPAAANVTTTPASVIVSTVETLVEDVFNTTSTTPGPPSEANLKYIVHYSKLANDYPELLTTNFWLYR